MPSYERAPGGVGCLSTIVGLVVLAGVVVLVFFVGFVVLGGSALSARDYALERRATLGADDRVLVEVEELDAARLTLALGAEFEFGHDFFP